MYKTPFSELKKRAWNNLTGKYLYALGVTLLVAAIAGVVSSVVSLISGGITSMFGITIDTGNLQQSVDLTAAVIAIYTAVISSLFAIVVNIFVSMPLSVGLIKFFINAITETHKVEDIFFAYKSRPKNVIFTSFLSQLFILLWSCLLLIPGIIKSYEYSMIPYILAENPAIDRKRAFELSKELTRGNKFRIFLFELSFIGWILLGTLACGIGVIFVVPYFNASKAQLYLDLKVNAVSRGAVNAEDFEYHQESIGYNY